MRYFVLFHFVEICNFSCCWSCVALGKGWHLKMGDREGAKGLNLISVFAQLLIRQCQAMLLHFHSACEMNNKK